MSKSNGALVETSEADWDRTHSVNLKGVFLGCKYAIPTIKKGGGGAIVNIASVLGIVADPDLAAYCAAKGGVISLTRVAALTYGALKLDFLTRACAKPCWIA